jgi:hypothetical protein
MTTTNADIVRYASRLDAHVTKAWNDLDDEHRDRQLLLEALIVELWAVAREMTAGVSRCDMPECTEHPATPAGTHR